MLYYCEGDMFDKKADIRVNAVNCVGAMGAGVAYQFKKRYPTMYREYQKRCQKGLVNIGSMDVHNFAFDDNGRNKNAYDCNIIINFPTKKHYRNKSRLSWIMLGLVSLKKTLIGHIEQYDDFKHSSVSVNERGYISVTIPALGCGYGGLEWNCVKEQFERFFNNRKESFFSIYRIYIFLPH